MQDHGIINRNSSRRLSLWRHIDVEELQVAMILSTNFLDILRSPERRELRHDIPALLLLDSWSNYS
jgi:hypothetical protein